MIDDVAGNPRRPLKTLSIRELVLELGNIEELVVIRADTAGDTYAARFITQREQLIIAELRSRAACLHPCRRDNAPVGADEEAGEWVS